MQLTTAFVALLSATTAMGAVVRRSPNPKSSKAFLTASTMEASTLEASAVADTASTPPQDIDTYYWTGGVVDRLPPNERITSVSAKVVIPTPRIPKGGLASVPYGVAFWIGIDGISNNIILQLGIVLDMDKKGRLRFQICYQWFPGFVSCDFKKHPDVSPADVVYMSLESLDGTKATVVINNESKGQSFSTPINVPGTDGKAKLPGQSAEWMMEEYPIDPKHDRILPPAFDPFVFTQATVKTSTGRTLSPADGRVVDYSPLLAAANAPNMVTVTREGITTNAGAVSKPVTPPPPHV